MKSKYKIIMICIIALSLVLSGCTKNQNLQSQGASSSDSNNYSLGASIKNSLTKSSTSLNSSLTQSSTSLKSSLNQSSNNANSSLTQSSKSLNSSLSQSSNNANSSAKQSASTSHSSSTTVGESYSVSGAIASNNGVYTIKNDFIIKFDKSSLDFNKITFNYDCSEALVCIAKYGTSQEISDTFYLEKGEQNFGILTKGFLEGTKYSSIKSLTFSTIENKQATFSFENFSFVSQQKLSNDITYLENSRYKVGIKLSWGGGICYIKDKTHTISGVDNLVNQADVGRLVQQSYYGTNGSADYVAGTYNGSEWCYNPVQGGDLYNNHSRLIDVEIKSNQIYVKSQPQDWAKNNQLTPSYMQNTYTIDNEKITVNNRFIDFSGFEHRYAHQELPALYLISYLDSFSYYDGTNPWTDDSLKISSSLPFWGDASLNQQCYHYFKNSNTQTWCAFSNTSQNFGVGIYTPNIDCLLAGRHNYNASKDSANSACSYVAPLKTIKLKSFEALSYSYILSSGSLQEMSNVFKNSKDFETNLDLDKNSQSMRVSDSLNGSLNFSTKSELSQIVPTNASVLFDSAESAAKLVVSGVDPQVAISYSAYQPKLKAESISKIIIRYKIPSSSNAYCCDLFYCVGSILNPDANYVIRKNLIADNAYHDLELSADWSGNLNSLRFDFFDNASIGTYMYIKSISLI